MNRYTLLKQTVLFLTLSFLVFSCDSTSSDDNGGQPPQIPDLETIQPDISYFTNNNPMKQTDYDHFYEGKNYATLFSGMTSLGNYSAMWLGLTQMEGKKSDGRWIWDFTFPTEEGVFSMVLSARESGNEFLWDMTISMSGGDVNINDYKMFEGRTNMDGSRGSWTFYSMDFEGGHQGPMLVSEWEQKSETEIVIETRFYHENGSEEGLFTYTQSGVNYSLVGNFSDSDTETVTIVWNTDSMVGYLDHNGERKCWNSNFQDTACS